jgi:hypothetical protein
LFLRNSGRKPLHYITGIAPSAHLSEARQIR